MDINQFLEEAYSDPCFQTKIQKTRLEIEQDLRKFIKNLNEQKAIGLKIFENLESRVKSKTSFCEKIKRKDYINLWKVPTDKSMAQDYIAKNLPDLIGFRINCFFYKDEEIIFNEMKKYYEDNNFGSDYSIDFHENREQENGHIIYKVSGCYKEINFEIQVKCSVHNIWGEVEHSRIYKSEHYDPKIESKKKITEEVFSILKSSDRQLMTIFEEKYSVDDLIKSLFYQYTYNEVFLNENISILSKHYQNFFGIFKDTEHMERIKKYVSAYLIGESYSKPKLDFNRANSMSSEEFLDIYIEFEIKIVYRIASLLYDWSDLYEFVYYLINRVEKLSIDPLEEIYDVDYGDPEEQQSKINLKENIIIMYNDFFRPKEGITI